MMERPKDSCLPCANCGHELHLMGTYWRVSHMGFHRGDIGKKDFFGHAVTESDVVQCDCKEPKLRPEDECKYPPFKPASGWEDTGYEPS